MCRPFLNPRLVPAVVVVTTLAVLANLLVLCAQPAKTDPDLDRILKDAMRVLVLAKRDQVAGAKESEAVFAAAHALEKRDRAKEAVDFFQEGLRLSPWNLDEQLDYAHLLTRLNQKDEAAEIATMVRQRAETDALANHALKILGKGPVAPPPTWDGTATGPWLCFVKVGPVDDVMLRESMEKMSQTLGIPAWLLDTKVGLPKPDRSSFDRWVKREIIPKVKWFTPEAMKLLRSLGASTPEEVVPRKLVGALIQSLEDDGLEQEAANLQNSSAFYQKSDQQWSASNLLGVTALAVREHSNPRNAIIVGITSADLYDGDSNFLFGTAATGAGHCIVSCARFRAAYYGDPPDRARLVTRLHKQLLSSIGFALGVPRPLDPTSARAYPASIPEHDAKSEYMSPACVRGFEAALKRPLPPEARPPERR